MTEKRQTKRLVVPIDIETHRKLKAAVAIKGTTIADLVRELVKDWLDKT
jgi:hypothetical protein